MVLIVVLVFVVVLLNGFNCGYGLIVFMVLTVVLVLQEELRKAEAAKKEESEIKKEMARIRKEMEDERKKHEEQKLRSVEILIEFRYGFQHLCFTSV